MIMTIKKASIHSMANSEPPRPRANCETKKNIHGDRLKFIDFAGRSSQRNDHVHLV